MGLDRFSKKKENVVCVSTSRLKHIKITNLHLCLWRRQYTQMYNRGIGNIDRASLDYLESRCHSE